MKLWSLFTEEERAYFGRGLAQALAFFDPELAAQSPDEATALAWVMQIQNAPITISRARHTEDSLELDVQQGVQQYVILGAGLDTFAFRRPEMLTRLQVFEVDRPATQADKRRRIAEAGWQLPPQLHFVPVDFRKENLAAILRRTSYDPQKKSFFSWLGVTFYLARDVVNATLRDIAAVSPAGSSIVFDYVDSDAFIAERAAKRMRKMHEIVRNAGEPLITGFDPSTLSADLAALGLQLKQDLGPSDIKTGTLAGARIAIVRLSMSTLHGRRSPRPSIDSRAEVGYHGSVAGKQRGTCLASRSSCSPFSPLPSSSLSRGIFPNASS